MPSCRLQYVSAPSDATMTCPVCLRGHCRYFWRHFKKNSNFKPITDHLCGHWSRSNYYYTWLCFEFCSLNSLNCSGCCWCLRQGCSQNYHLEFIASSNPEMNLSDTGTNLINTEAVLAPFLPTYQCWLLSNLATVIRAIPSNLVNSKICACSFNYAFAAYARLSCSDDFGHVRQHQIQLLE